MRFQTGLDAIDMKDIVTKAHATNLELATVKVQEQLEEIKGNMETLVAFEENNKSENRSMRNRAIIFGVISVVVMGLSTYLQITYLKNFFKYKKII